MPKPDPDQARVPETEAQSGRFEQTHWSMVLNAGAESSTALNTLLTTYRAPLFSYLRGRCLQPADASDLLNGFYAVLLRREFLKDVSAAGGRFRTFLLRCLDNYLRDEAAKAKALKRGGGVPSVSLDEPDEEGVPKIQPAGPGRTPAEAFDREWALAVLRGGFRRLKESYQRRGKAELCQALEPVLYQDATAPAYRELSLRLYMSEQALRAATSRMRTELRECIREEIKQTVGNPRDWEAECRHFLAILQN